MKHIKSLANVTNEAVEKATGRSWAFWINYLDKQGAGLAYKEKVQLLQRVAGIESAWWSRKITTGYEQQKGHSSVGQTQTAGFQIGARKTFPIPAGKAWDLLTTADGLAIWLGTTLPDEEEDFKTKDGISGSISIFKPGSHLRMKWQPVKWKNNSTLQVRVLSSGKQSVISFHHDGLADEKQREAMKLHWKEVLEALYQLAAK